MKIKNKMLYDFYIFENADIWVDNMECLDADKLMSAFSKHRIYKDWLNAVERDIAIREFKEILYESWLCKQLEKIVLAIDNLLAMK